MDKGIPNAIYYPVPLHRQKAYLDDRYKEELFKVTNELVEYGHFTSYAYGIGRGSAGSDYPDHHGVCTIMLTYDVI